MPASVQWATASRLGVTASGGHYFPLSPSILMYKFPSGLDKAMKPNDFVRDGLLHIPWWITERACGHFKNDFQNNFKLLKHISERLRKSINRKTISWPPTLYFGPFFLGLFLLTLFIVSGLQALKPRRPGQGK